MIAADKWFHFLAGISVFATVNEFCIKGDPLGYAVSMGAVAVVAVGKEVWDHYHPPHVADGWDIFATALGGFYMLTVKLIAA